MRSPLLIAVLSLLVPACSAAQGDEADQAADAIRTPSSNGAVGAEALARRTEELRVALDGAQPSDFVEPARRECEKWDMHWVLGPDSEGSFGLHDRQKDAEERRLSPHLYVFKNGAHPRKYYFKPGVWEPYQEHSATFDKKTYVLETTLADGTKKFYAYDATFTDLKFRDGKPFCPGPHGECASVEDDWAIEIAVCTLPKNATALTCRSAAEGAFQER